MRPAASRVAPRRPRGARPARAGLVALALAAAPLLLSGGALLLGAPAPAGAALPRTVGVGGGASPTLGGYTLAATAAGLRITYEQPNLPIPATPSAELDLGYAAATLDSGPVGQATASEAYPGQVIAASGSQLGAIIPGAPALPDWPVQAHASSPGGAPSAKDDDGPVTMEASSAGATSRATAAVGSSVAGAPAAIPAAFVVVQHLAGSAVDAAAASPATAAAAATASGIALMGGLVDVKTVTTKLSASSAGAATAYRYATTVSGVTVAGQPVTVDGGGVHLTGHDVPIGLFGLTPLQVLQQAGISLRVAHATRAPAAAGGAVTASGLEIRLDFTTFDADLAKLVAELPSQLTSVLYRLPVPLPDQQILTIDAGWAQVSDVATPAYVPPPNQPPPTIPPTTVPLAPPTTAAPSPSGAGGFTTPPGGGATVTGALSGSPKPSAGRPPSPKPAVVPTPIEAIPASAGVPTVFRGVGAGLVGAGLLATAGFVFAVLRGDKRMFAMAGRRACAALASGPGGAGSGAGGGSGPGGTGGSAVDSTPAVGPASEAGGIA